MELLVPFVVKAVVDHGIADGNKSYIIYGCLILAAFGVVGLAFALTAQYFAARAAVGTSAELRSRLFAKLQSFSYSQIDGTGTAAMVARMTSDVNQTKVWPAHDVKMLGQFAITDKCSDPVDLLRFADWCFIWRRFRF